MMAYLQLRRIGNSKARAEEHSSGSCRELGRHRDSDEALKPQRGTMHIQHPACDWLRLCASHVVCRRRSVQCLQAVQLLLLTGEGAGGLTVMREGATDTPAGLMESMNGVIEISTGWMLMPMGDTSTP